MKNIATILFITLLTQYSMANNALRGKDFSSSGHVDERVELQVNPEMTRAPVTSGLTRSDVAAVIPTNMRTTKDGDLVRDRILSRTLTSIMKSPVVTNNFLFKAAKKVEESANVGMKIKEDSKPNSTNAAAAKPTEHKFDFNVEAFKREARLSYNGYIDSKIEYKMQDQSLQFSIEESLSKNSKIAVTHLTNSLEQKQYLMYRLNW